jgi:hypothetical protein
MAVPTALVTTFAMTLPDDDERTVLVPNRTATPPPARGGNALPVGARLGEFEITGLLGEGGFGIVYLAWDCSLERQVALKEYMPSSFASRSCTMQVAVTAERDADTFDAGLRSFVNEARILARFDHPALIKVYRFWEANGTAYMVMPYYEGRTLKQTLLARTEPVDETWLRSLLAPLLDTLTLIHQHQCFHRDIAPDNIMMLTSNRPLLLDFGAARRAIGGMQQAFTVILKQNYAPIEQYADMPGMTQGPWTDLYALASVVHFAIAGSAPPPAVSRLVQDPYVPLATRYAGRFSADFLAALDQTLAVRPEQRPQSAAALRTLLGLADAPNQPASTPALVSAPAPTARRRSRFAAGGVALLAAAAAVFWLAGRTPLQAVAQGPMPAPLPAPSPAPPVASVAPFDPLAALEQVGAGAQPDRAVIVTTQKSRVRIGHDRFQFAVHASRDGYLYVQMVGSDRNNFFLLFPNAIDKDNRIKAGQTLLLPRAGWHMGVPGPVGVDHFVAIVSDAPRSFESAGLVPADLFAEFPLAQAGTLQRAYRGATPLFAGTPTCTPPCSAAYGASRFSIEEVD